MSPLFPLVPSGCACNWVSGDTNNLADVFVYTRTPVSAIRASVSETGTQGTGASWAPALAGAADVVAFVSNADDLAAGDVSDFDDIFVRDFAANSTTRVTREDGTELNGNSRQPSISDDGNLVAFVTEATNVETAGTTSGLGKVVVWDRRDGTLSTVSVNNSGDAADRSSAFPRISGNGRYVVFISSATNLGPDSNGLLDVYRRDLQTGVTECASMGRDGFAATAFRSSADISGDGRFIVFGSISGALVDNDYNGVGDVFLRDMQMANTMVVSVTPNLRVANDLSRPRAIAPDGTAIAFISDATDVVAGDNNGFADVFVVNDLSW